MNQTDRASAEEERLGATTEALRELRLQLGRRIVGHEALIEGVLATLFVGGHILLEGVPGLGKTLLFKTLGEALQLDFSRIQFTPDLMPADVIGTQMVVQDESGGRHFKFEAGPVFTQLLLADEINRATPKTQSALLEAMEEGAVTVGREVHRLSPPFAVLATQNPIEMEGTYPLPEAQLDRFMVKLEADYPDAAELTQIVDRAGGQALPEVQQVMDADQLLEVRVLMRDVTVARHVKDYAVRLTLATHPSEAGAPESVQQFVRHGASPRGLLSMVLAAKAFAIFDGRLNVSLEDLKRSAPLVFRHRILLNFEGEADGVGPDELVADILNQVDPSSA